MVNPVADNALATLIEVVSASEVQFDAHLVAFLETGRRRQIYGQGVSADF